MYILCKRWWTLRALILGEDIGESESLSYLQSSGHGAFQTEEAPIDPSRQKRNLFNNLSRGKKIKILKPNKFGKVFAARTTCIESEQKILHGAFGREARQKGSTIHQKEMR